MRPCNARLDVMLLQDLNPRAQTILRLIVDSYVTSGDAVGSRTLSKNLAKTLGHDLSPASIRNAMADLEDAGLLFSAHTSAGRLPTDAGLRLFVDRLMEVTPLNRSHQTEIEKHLDLDPKNLPAALERASIALSSLSQCAGLVAAPKKDRPFRQVEFVSLAPDRILVVWVDEDGAIENRIVETQAGLTQSDLQKASNYLNHHLFGKTLSQARVNIERDILEQKTELNLLTQKLVREGLIVPNDDTGLVIVRGQSHLLNDVKEVKELDRLRKLFNTLEQRETLLKLVDHTADAQGVQIFIGAQNDLFNHSGCAMIVAPYTNKDKQVVGAIGVIGPSRLNYGRIIPMVDYTAQLLSGAL